MTTCLKKKSHMPLNDSLGAYKITRMKDSLKWGIVVSLGSQH